MAPLSIPSFASTQLSLLTTELSAELASSAALIANHTPTALQRAGLALTNLVISSRRTGLGGRTVLELELDPAVASKPAAGASSAELPEHGIRTGDIVLVSEQPAGSAKKREVKELEKKGARGVVTRVRREAVGIALDEGRDGEEKDVEFGGRVWIVKLADEVTYKR